MGKQKTAVEFFSEQIQLILIGEKQLSDVLQQAIKLEKEQIQNAYKKGCIDAITSLMNEFNEDANFTKKDLKNQQKNAQKYYIETYGK